MPSFEVNECGELYLQIPYASYLRELGRYNFKVTFWFPFLLSLIPYFGEIIRTSHGLPLLDRAVLVSLCPLGRMTHRTLQFSGLRSCIRMEVAERTGYSNTAFPWFSSALTGKF
jgi:hypothetical protein